MSPDDPRHGEYRGWHAHRKEESDPCQPCRLAMNAYERRRRKSRTLYGTRWAVDITGTRRRVRALHRLGWTAQHIGDLVGVSRERISQLSGLRQKYVTRSTAAAIDRAYDRLSMRVGPSAITRRRAEAKGWAPPLAWDDIDDPNERPKTGQRGRGRTDVDPVVVQRAIAGDRLPLTTAERFAVVAALRARGMSLVRIEAHTGITKAERYTDRTEHVA